MHPSSKRLAPIFAAIATLTIVSSLVVYWAGLRVAEANARLVRTRDVSAELLDMLSTLKDAETGQRGFLLTGDEKYAEPYDAAIQHIGQDLRQLQHWAQTQDVPATTAALITRLTQQKLDELKLTMELRRGKSWETALTGLSSDIGKRAMDSLRGQAALPRQQGPAAALAVVQLDIGKQLMDDLRKQITSLETQEQQETRRLRQQRDQATNLRTTLTLVVALVDLAFLGWAFTRIAAGVATSERAATEISRQKDLLAVTLSSIGDAVIITDPQGRITFLNGEAQRLTGWSGNDAAGQPLPNVFRIVNEQTRQTVENPADKVLRLGMVVGLANHTVLIAKDGRETPIDDSGAPIRSNGAVHGVVLVFRDITERRQAEDALRQSESKLRAFVESSIIGILYGDLDGHIYDCNEELARIVGRPRQDVLDGKVRWTEITPPEDLPLDEKAAQEAKATGRCTPYEKHYIRPDGTIVPLVVGYVLLEPERYKSVAFILDISKRKRMELELKDARDSAEGAKSEAERANRAKDHFLAVLSHELRTPLTPVVTAVSMLQNMDGLDEQMRENLELIRRNVALEAQLIDDLLDVTRIARGKIELDRKPVDLCQVIQRAVEVVQPDIEARHLHFGVDAQNSAYIVDADATRLQQVFWNLLRNAVKFTPLGGCVGIYARADDTGHVLVEVRDSGEGIEPDALSRIFNAFEQAERSITRQFGGLGLGLTISKALVELHGGTIEAHSPGKGKGATFRIQLPLVTVSPSPATPPNLAPASASVRPLRILLVEDHGDTAKMMRQLLMQDGHTVERAGDVASALDMLAQHTFDLLISDLGLPDRSGLDLMRELRSRGHTLPGIALSGYGQEQDIRRSKEAGFAAHLTKPTNPDRLAEVIAACCDP